MLHATNQMFCSRVSLGGQLHPRGLMGDSGNTNSDGNIMFSHARDTTGTPVGPSGGICQVGEWKVIKKMKDFCKIFQRPAPRHLLPGACLYPRPSRLPLATSHPPSTLCPILRLTVVHYGATKVDCRNPMPLGGEADDKRPGVASSFLLSLS